MTDQLTPNTVVQGLLGLARELAELSKGLDLLEADAVNKREDLTLASAKAFLSAVGPVDVRKNIALVETHDERLAAELAEALVRGRKRQLDSLKVRIDVGRSAAAALRAEISLAGTQ
jgi:hypothetical protein